MRYLGLLLVLAVCGCSSSTLSMDASGSAGDVAQSVADTTLLPEDAAASASDGFVFEPQVKRESRGPFNVVWLAGTPYEMGQQHAQLLRPEIEASVKMVDKDLMLNGMLIMAKLNGLIDLAKQCSFDEIIEECQGQVDETQDIGWTMDKCLALNFGDVIVDFLAASNSSSPGAPEAPGCSQVVAASQATTDGRLLHGRLMDWSKIQVLIDYPVIFVRQPAGGIPHVMIGYPGNITPYQGLNAEGLSVASNEIRPRDSSITAPLGRSHIQFQARLLARAHNLEQARAMADSLEDMGTDIIVVTDGRARKAEVLEMAPAALGIRPLEQGVVQVTNHFLAAPTADLDHEPTSSGSQLRLDRLEQLTLPGGQESLHGMLTPQTMVTVLRDRKHPQNGSESPVTIFDNNLSIATNGALYAVVFDPAHLDFWVAAGKLPVPSQPFMGFNLGELLGVEGYKTPATIP